MRRFYSYGPVDGRYHYCLPRRELIKQLIDQLGRTHWVRSFLKKGVIISLFGLPDRRVRRG